MFDAYKHKYDDRYRERFLLQLINLIRKLKIMK